MSLLLDPRRKRDGVPLRLAENVAQQLPDEFDRRVVVVVNEYADRSRGGNNFVHGNLRKTTLARKNKGRTPQLADYVKRDERGLFRCSIDRDRHLAEMGAACHVREGRLGLGEWTH